MNRRAAKRIVLTLAITLTAGLWACRSTKQNLNKPPESPATPAAPVNQSPFDLIESKLIEVVSPFDHDRKEHNTKTQDCAACHLRATNDPKPVLPGHSACRDCHSKDLSSAESKMCIVCHKTPAGRNNVIEFPNQLGQFGLKRFSHRDHANPEKMKGQMDTQKMP